MGRKKIHEFEKACTLFNTGMTRKEISKELSIDEHTIGRWFKKWKEETEHVKQAISNIKVRLSKMTADENTPVQDIKDLTYSLELLQRHI